jgi:hypothetical protein
VGAAGHRDGGVTHDYSQARPARPTPTMANRLQWCRVHDQAPERPDTRVPSHLPACSPHRLPSRPPSLKPHGPYRLDPDRAAPVCCADSALVNTSPSPAPLPRYPSAQWPTAHARDTDLIHHRRRGEERACDGRDKPARKAWCLWCTTSCLASTTHRGQGSTPPTESRQGYSRNSGPAPTTPAVRSVRSGCGAAPDAAGRPSRLSCYAWSQLRSAVSTLRASIPGRGSEAGVQVITGEFRLPRPPGQRPPSLR